MCRVGACESSRRRLPVGLGVGAEPRRERTGEMAALPSEVLDGVLAFLWSHEAFAGARQACRAWHARAHEAGRSGRLRRASVALDDRLGVVVGDWRDGSVLQVAGPPSSLRRRKSRAAAEPSLGGLATRGCRDVFTVRHDQSAALWFRLDRRGELRYLRSLSLRGLMPIAVAYLPELECLVVTGAGLALVDLRRGQEQVADSLPLMGLKVAHSVCADGRGRIFVGCDDATSINALGRGGPSLSTRVNLAGLFAAAGPAAGATEEQANANLVVRLDAARDRFHRLDNHGEVQVAVAERDAASGCLRFAQPLSLLPGSAGCLNRPSGLVYSRGRLFCSTFVSPSGLRLAVRVPLPDAPQPLAKRHVAKADAGAGEHEHASEDELESKDEPGDALLLPVRTCAVFGSDDKRPWELAVLEGKLCSVERRIFAGLAEL